MRIESVRIQNYRSIEDLTITFPTYYTAICGKNDAGKSNIIRVLRYAFTGPDRPFFGNMHAVTLKDDFTKWKDNEKHSGPKFIQFDFCLSIDPADDEGLYRFLIDYLQLPSNPASKAKPVSLRLMLRLISDQPAPQIGIELESQPVEALKAQELLKKLQSSFTVLFHDSTDVSNSYEFLETNNLFREMSSAEATQIEWAKTKLDRVLKKIAKRNQQDLTTVLGRLKDKYKLGIRVDSRIDSESDVPYSITLGSEDIDVDLERWGSGTQNRTRILMTIFKAKLVRESEASASKVTPIIVVEEPESYLHPSAQAEFGLILRDLAEEFKVQIVVTTHSPYLLSLGTPTANILLERKIVRNKVRSTECIDTSGDKWMEPFSLALGVGGTELAPWKNALFATTDSVLLVEGDTDKEYLSLLDSDAHGDNRLNFTGVVFAYGGKDTLKQKQLLRFIKSRFKRFIVTYDLDCESEIEGHLKEIGLIKGKDYIPVGRESTGKKSIEGLLPDSVLQSVFSKEVDLVQRATAATGTEAKNAKSTLKKLYLEEFKKTALPRTDAYKHFYSLSKQLNKMI